MDGIIDILKKTGALCEGHYAEVDGSCSRVRVVMPRLFQHPGETQLVAAELAARLPGIVPDLIVGVGENSAILAYELARQMHACCLYAIRRNGTMAVQRKFEIPAGAHALIVEDAVLNGKSIRETVELLRALNVDILGIASVLDMSEGAARFRFPFYPLAEVSPGNMPQRLCPLCHAGVPLTHES